jgi:YD repeat-containing protein
MKYPNSLQSTLTYDDLNRVTAVNNSKTSYTYQLDQAGNRKQVTESGGPGGELGVTMASIG